MMSVEFSSLYVMHLSSELYLFIFHLHCIASSSCHFGNCSLCLKCLLQEFFEEVGPLESLQLGGSTLEGLLQVFNCYINLLIHALPGTMETEDNLGGSGHKIVRMAETESQQLALLANASMLADELLPRGAMKLSPLHQTGRMDTPGRVSERQNRFPEHREWKRKLQRAVDRLRDSFCRQHALELIFTEDGEIRLTAEIYTSMDGSTNEPEWFPSPIFQVIQYKLQASILLEKVLFLSSVTSALKLLFLSYATNAFKLLLSDTNTRFLKVKPKNKMNTWCSKWPSQINMSVSSHNKDAVIHGLK